MNLKEIIADAVEELDEWIEDNPGEDPDYDGTLHEIADSAVPVYHSELMDVACADRQLMLDVPELGPAFDGEPTPVNIIAANIYEAVTAALYERWQGVEDSDAEWDAHWAETDRALSRNV